jgi:hypothetical protein
LLRIILNINLIITPKKIIRKKEQAMMRDCNQRRFELQALAGQEILKIQNILKSQMIIVSNRIGNPIIFDITLF